MNEKGEQKSGGSQSAGLQGTGRQGIAIAAAMLLACGGLVGYGGFATNEQPAPHAVPTAEVTYEVTGDGTAEISYLARNESGSATGVKDAALPWKKTVQVPLGKDPTVAIVLGYRGGQAACTLAVRGAHVQRATASGTYGRATCSNRLPRS
ncbi:MmpS family transport accessory protein [Streptomyces sp. NPDC057486]|uniref:MmpS family transport accessory protein n=1 Tax=Streptomyces sp. NPDC057486 TaxID=3346145 RepID=UPI0036BEA94D